MPDYHPFLRGFTLAGISFRTPEERTIATAHGAEYRCTCVGTNKAGYPSLSVQILHTIEVCAFALVALVAWTATGEGPR